MIHDIGFQKLILSRPKGESKKVAFSSGISTIKLVDQAQFHDVDKTDYIKHLIYRYSVLDRGSALSYSNLDYDVSDLAFAARIGILYLKDVSSKYLDYNMTITVAVNPSQTIRISQPYVPVCNAAFLRDCVYLYCKINSVSCLSMGDRIGNVLVSNDFITHIGYHNWRAPYDVVDVARIKSDHFLSGKEKGYYYLKYDSVRTSDDIASSSFWKSFHQLVFHTLGDEKYCNIYEIFPDVGIDTVNMHYAGLTSTVNYSNDRERRAHGINCSMHGVKPNVSERERNLLVLPASQSRDIERPSIIDVHVPSYDPSFSVYYINLNTSLTHNIMNVFNSFTMYPIVIFSVPSNYPSGARVFFQGTKVKYVISVNQPSKVSYKYTLYSINDRIMKDKFRRRVSRCVDDGYADDALSDLFTKYGLQISDYVKSKERIDDSNLDTLKRDNTQGILRYGIDGKPYISDESLGYVHVSLKHAFIYDLKIINDIAVGYYHNMIINADMMTYDHRRFYIKYCAFSLSNVINKYEDTIAFIDEMCNSRGICVIPNYNIANMFRFGEYDISVDDNVLIHGQYRDWLYYPIDFIVKGYGVCTLTDFPFKLLDHGDIERLPFPFVGDAIYNQLWFVVYDIRLTSGKRIETYSNINSIRQKKFTNLIRYALKYDTETFYRMRMQAIVDRGGEAISESKGFLITSSGFYPIVVSGHVLSMLLYAMIGVYDVNENLLHIENNSKGIKGSSIEGKTHGLWHSYAEWVIGLDSCVLYMNKIGLRSRVSMKYFYDRFNIMLQRSPSFGGVSDEARKQVVIPVQCKMSYSMTKVLTYRDVKIFI